MTRFDTHFESKFSTKFTAQYKIFGKMTESNLRIQFLGGS